jgi:hypothetical protein
MPRFEPAGTATQRLLWGLGSSSMVAAKVRLGPSAGPDRNPGVVEHQAGPVVDKAGLEVKGGSGVIITLAAGVVGDTGVGLLQPLHGQADSPDVGGGSGRPGGYGRPSRRTGSALVMAEASRSTSRQPSKRRAGLPSTS